MAFVLKKSGPPAPGAVSSPQVPGQVPDRSGVPGHGSERVTRPALIARPLTEYGSAQRIAGVFAAKPGQAADPARFEQAPPSFEELRKAEPVLTPPVRPTPGYDLNPGKVPAAIGAGGADVVKALPTGG